jgi:hypothetical protein
MIAWFRLHLWLLYIGLCFTGCASTPPQIVNIPVAVACAAKVSTRPTFPDTKDAIVAASNIEARVNLILAGRILRYKRIDELEAAIAGCQ